MEQRPLQLVGALRVVSFTVNAGAAVAVQSSQCSAIGACPVDTLLARGDVDDARLHI